MTGVALDQLLDLVDIRVSAFAICEIGREYSLKCDPHESVVVHFVLRGNGFLLCEHGRFALTPGCIVLVPRMLAKSLSGSGPIEHHRNATISCPLEDGLLCFRAISGEAELVLGCAVISANIGGELPLFQLLKQPIVERPEEEKLLAMFAVMLDEFTRPRVGTRAFVSAMMKQILVLLLRSRDQDMSSLMLPTINPQLAGVLATVIDRPQDNYTVEGLAASAGMSRSRFSHHFLQACRCSPKEFVQSVRLSSAAKLLRGSNLPVKSIAASVGYASRSHFSRAFQSRYGLDPSAFRKTPPAAAE